MIGTSPLQVIFGKVLASMTKDIMMKKDKRIKLTNEVTSISVILLTDEDPSRDKGH